MLSKLYKRDEVSFALLWIVVYVVGCSLADQMHKVVTLAFLLALSAVLGLWLSQNGLMQRYGLCRPRVSARTCAYYLPLAALVSCNLWMGVRLNLPPLESAVHVTCMLLVGFVEELIFRGFLFKGMAKTNLRSAIIVSSLTFGVGHIVNLFNGSGMQLLETLCQVCYAMAFGLLAVTLFHRTGSLIPCIAAHSVMNMLSVFANEAAVTPQADIAISLVLCVGSWAYTWFLHKRLPKEA